MEVLESIRHGVGTLSLKVAQRLHRHPYIADDPNVLRVSVYRRPTQPRWGWGRPPNAPLLERLTAQTDQFVEDLNFIRRWGSELGAIDHGHRDDFEPCWTNHQFHGIDGASLYAFLRDRNPARYVEIGSGYSTRFAARAKRDGGLHTEVVSIDPEPRVGIDEICDRIVREPLERADLSIFGQLSAGDVLYLDGSHRVLADNDVAVFFMEILPSLPAGVLIGVHDIFIPDDYPQEFVEDGWTEQYLLAVQVLSDRELRTVLPCHFVASRQPMKAKLDSLWNEIGLSGTNAWGSSYWFER